MLISDREKRAGKAWLDIALDEHASIASFARFTLQLVAVGAPAQLLQDTAAAIADEIRHARLAFGCASDLLRECFGPSTCDISRSVVEQPRLRNIAVDALLEGCIGEGIAAAHASLAAQRSAGRYVEVWNEIAEDEGRHAQLAWSFVEWSLDVQPDIARDLRVALTARRAIPPPVKGEVDDLEEFGILSIATKASAANCLYTEEILPRAESLLASAPPS